MNKLDKLIEAYADAVQVHGPDSAEAQAIRDQHSNDTEFAILADSLYRIRKRITRRTALAAAERSSGLLVRPQEESSGQPLPSAGPSAVPG